ncbi:MAG TPA: cytochrome c, partial [Parafilimonas sp.]
MFKLRRIATIKTLTSLLFLAGIIFSTTSFAQDGHALFQANCASCHKVDAKLVGPALSGVESRWPSRDKIHSWVHNSAAVIKSGDPYAVSLYNEFNKTQMTPFPQLSDKDIDAILDYIKSAPVATAATSTTTTGTESTE